MMEIIKRLVDNSEFDEYKAGYGQTIITGYAKLTDLVVKNCCQPKKNCKTAGAKTKPSEMQFGGVIYWILQIKQPFYCEL